jgi:hypothetical protein
MAMADEFLKYCSQTLEAKIGPLAKGIINIAQSKKSLNENSVLNDYEEFINVIETGIRIISGKNYAANLCNTLRSKAIEISVNKDAVDICKSIITETNDFNINDFLRRINITDIGSAVEITQKLKLTQGFINTKIDEFLKSSILPTERGITRYAISLSVKYGIDAEKAKKDIIAQIKIQVKDAIGTKAQREVINNFLTICPQPNENDIKYFIKYINLLKLKFDELDFKQKIEKERLYRKFQEPQPVEEHSELDQFIESIKTLNNEKDLSKEMRKQDLGYLIKDESGISDKMLVEFAKLVMLSKRETLEGILLENSRIDL